MGLLLLAAAIVIVFPRGERKNNPAIRVDRFLDVAFLLQISRELDVRFQFFQNHLRRRRRRVFVFYHHADHHHPALSLSLSLVSSRARVRSFGAFLSLSLSLS